MCTICNKPSPRILIASISDKAHVGACRQLIMEEVKYEQGGAGAVKIEPDHVPCVFNNGNIIAKLNLHLKASEWFSTSVGIK